MTRVRSTTVLAVRKDGRTVFAADGQVTVGQTVMKATAKKLRRSADGRVVAGFAGAAADGLALFEKLEEKLRDHGGNLARAAVELAKDWRTDRALRRLEAMLLVADKERLLLLSGSGDVIEPDENVAAIGSGGPFALAASRALLRHTPLDARQVAESALAIAAEMCVYTNTHVTYEEL
jgi:ATP-dependent HslUV protease subunit HslV